MYEVTKNVIQSGNYELTNILTKIDTLWLQGSLTDAERLELIEMARGKADPAKGLDLLSKVIELEDRIAKLEKAGDQGEPGSGDGTAEEEEYPEYVAGRWYRNGNRMSFGGKRYVCTVPDGVVCTWSPVEYPPYWQEVIE